MKGKYVFVFVFILAFSVITVAVAFVMHYVEEARVAAFAAAMSFVATALAALAAWGYLRETADLVKATKETALEQARVTRIMEADLRSRIAPNLQFRPLGGSTADRQADVANVGRGVAVETEAKVIYIPTNRVQILKLDKWLEPNKPTTVKIGQRPDESGFMVEMQCSDSAGLNKYIFKQDLDQHKTVEVVLLSQIAKSNS
jgi:hypothetical protein